jgi:hypothetical protein
VSSPLPPKQIAVLAIGDTLICLAVTWIGFASHDEGLAGGRWLITFLPLTLSWFLTAPWVGLFTTGKADRFQGFWRPAVGALFAAPLAVLLRALWLQSVVIPIFGLVMIAVTAAGMTLWRLAWIAWSGRAGRKQMADG